MPNIINFNYYMVHGTMILSFGEKMMQFDKEFHLTYDLSQKLPQKFQLL